VGVRWGLGHSAGVAGVALLALALRDLLPLEALSALGERAVGVVLVGVGVWGFYQLMGSRLAGSASLEGRPRGHVSLLSPLSIGTLHGVAGSSHLLGVVPALALPVPEAAGWVLGFGAGTVAAMAGFGAALGSVPGRLRRPLVGLSSAAAVVVGLWWLSGGP
jgi:hypothetical protein